jgi:multiple sugar transport system ATP-binding protein
MLGQRPEHIHLSDDAQWRGEVSLVEPTGADTYVVVKTQAGVITVRAAANTKLTVGQQIGLSVSSRHNNWFDNGSGVRLS